VTDPDPRDAILAQVPALRSFALSLTRNLADADDLVQATIVRAWLFTFLRNISFSGKRKTRRMVDDPDQTHVMSLLDQPQHDGRLAFGAFRRLSPEHHEELILVGANG